MITLVANEKGGVGKTTIATNLATVKTVQGSHTLLIDTDKQQSSNYWSQLRLDSDHPKIVTISKFGNVKSELQAFIDKFDDIVVDAGGRDSIEMRSAMLVADILISPLKPSQFDLWTLAKINRHVSDAKMINENLKAYVLINEASTHHKSKEKELAQEYIEEFDEIELLDTVVHQRKAFRDAAKEGMGVIELPAQDEKATAEILSLYEEVYNAKK